MDILLNDLQAKGTPENDHLPLDAIGRVDYCFDFSMEKGFQPSFKNFVCHSRTKKSEIGSLNYNQISTGQGVETITVGKMPNRQVTILNQIKEITMECFEKQLKGTMTTFTALHGKDVSQIPEVLELISGQILEDMNRNPQKLIQKYSKAKNKYSFLGAKENNKSKN